MLYQQLTKITELDRQITKLHKDLYTLYEERSALLHKRVAQGEVTARRVTSSSQVFQSVKQSTNSDTAVPILHEPRTMYDDLQKTWEGKQDLALPTFKSLSKKLIKSCAVIDTLARNEPHLADTLSIVAIPPTKVLRNWIEEAITQQPTAFTNDLLEMLDQTKQVKSWSLAVVVSKEYAIPVYGLQNFIETEGYHLAGYDCRGIGIQEVLAAELQGIEVVHESGWTLLLKGASNLQPAPCVKKIEGHFVFGVDDADCLLDINYFQPAVVA